MSLPKYNEKSKDSVLHLAEYLIGKRLEDILASEQINEINSLKGNKGGYGQIIEKYIF